MNEKTLEQLEQVVADAVIKLAEAEKNARNSVQQAKQAIERAGRCAREHIECRKELAAAQAAVRHVKEAK